MIKRIVQFILVLIVLFVIAYFLNDYLLNLNNSYLSFSLLNIYVFHLISAILVYVAIELVFNKMPNQAGYLYLVSVFLKMGFFVLFFQSSVFAGKGLIKSEKLSLIIPLFLFLIAEAIWVSKLLNNK